MAFYVIEINGPQNESVIFAPTRDRLRGRWDFSKTHHRDKNDAMKVLATRASVIPGICISIDTETRIGLIFDPLLDTNEGKKILERLNGVAEQFQHVFGGGWKPWPRRQHQLTADELKTWGHVMRQLCDEGLAGPLGGQMPSRHDIAGWPGRRTRDPGNTGPQDEKLARYVDVVPEDAEPAMSGPPPDVGGKGKK